jgi:multidrug efflux pump subunit AcrA (membrane-fusion protein)
MRLNHADNVLTIPVGALVLKGSGYQVYVLDPDNHIRTRDVEVGLRGNQLVEIKSGLQSGERVILAAQGKYTEGEPVTPVVAREPASETAPQSGGVIDMSGGPGAGNGGAQ